MPSSFASEIPEGHILTINNIKFGDIYTGLFFSSTNTQLIVHVRKFFDNTENRKSLGVDDMASGEHYISEVLKEVKDSDTRPINKNVFLDSNHGKINEAYSVCFEFRGIGTSCKLINAQEVVNASLDLEDHGKTFGTISYNLTPACLEEISPENFNQYKEVLIKFNSMKMDFHSKNGLQIRLSDNIENPPQYSKYYGWVGDRGYRYSECSDEKRTERCTTPFADQHGKIDPISLSMIIPSKKTLGFSVFYTKYNQGGGDIPSTVGWESLNHWNLSFEPYDHLTNIDFLIDGKDSINWTWQNLKIEMNISVFGINQS